jgi:hydroxymethylbilane synthase
MRLRISARQSSLAKLQAYQVGEALLTSQPDCKIEYLFRESLGDKNLTDPLWKMPEKGVFTEDFLQDLREGETDMVVHSWKDLPTEAKPDTWIAATLPRADQRDLLLFKKKSLQKPRLRIFSSSPRRAQNLTPFLNQYLPWQAEEIEFCAVRGNIQTRVQKMLDDESVDALVLAKAAIDRLLGEDRFPEIQLSLRNALEQCQWMVLPLSANPNAAAQGALAVEISNKAPEELQRLLKKINCSSSYQCAQREREILQEQGGGCHLALGMAVLERTYGRIEFVKGLLPNGEVISKQNFSPVKKLPQGMKTSRLEFQSQRHHFTSCPSLKADAVFVARADAWPSNGVGDKLVWSAGLRTWKKLAALGVWVHGSAEGLGEAEDPRVDILYGSILRWARLTHENSPEFSESRIEEQIATYQLRLRLSTESLAPAEAWIWKSASEFQLALQKFPELRQRAHICGPGRTFESIRRELGSEQNIYVELNDEFSTAI